MKLLRCSDCVCAVLGLGFLLAAGALLAQNAAQPAAGGHNPRYRTSFAVYDLKTKTIKTVFTADGTWECPSWTRDGKYLIANMGGSLYRIPIDGDKTGAAERIALSEPMRATNDHALSYDGKQLAISGFTGELLTASDGWRIGPHGEATSKADLFIANLDGSHAHRLLIGWLHGWSPDGKSVVFVANHKGDFDLFRVNVDGSGETQLTTSPAQDDGPEYTADGKWIYFCSNRSGKWEIWRMPAAGAGPHDELAQKVTGSDAQAWFPHVSPDGKWLYAITYPPEQPGHLFIGTNVELSLWPLPDGPGGKPGPLRTISTFYGGQGSGNTTGWSPDSRKIVWSVYEKLAAESAR